MSETFRAVIVQTGKTACGIPPAAHTSSYPPSAVSTRVRTVFGWPTGATPPMT